MAVPACFSGGADLRPPDTHLLAPRTKYFLGGGVAPTSRYFCRCCCLLLLLLAAAAAAAAAAGNQVRLERKK